MSTYRERREAKAERLRLWADGREAKADAASKTAQRIGDAIPFGQPILVGHHSERGHRRDIARIDGAMRASVENGRTADRMRERADNIERAAAGAIYNDDADALERLAEKLAKLEAKRERMKAANAAYRKEHRAALKAMNAYERSQAVPFPSYAISNLGGVITNTRKRIEQLSRPETGRRMLARYGGECRECGAGIEKDEAMTYYSRTRTIVCASCTQ